MSDIGDWLNRYGLGKYTTCLLENGIDFDILPSLSSEDLKKLGFSLGDRKRLKAAIDELPDSESESKSVPAVATVPTAEAERRYLTVMFADLVRSTELSLLMDPEVLRQINHSGRQHFESGPFGTLCRIWRGHCEAHTGGLFLTNVDV